MLANTKGFTPDIGDTIPGGFGKAEWTTIVDFVNGKPLDAGACQCSQSPGGCLEVVIANLNLLSFVKWSLPAGETAAGRLITGEMRWPLQKK